MRQVEAPITGLFDPKGPIYLDHNATTPCDPRVLQAMWPYFSQHFGNPGSRTHSYGMRARSAVEMGRSQVGALIGAHAKEIVFTAGATEANNLAILGVADAQSRPKHLIISAIEHPSVIEPARALERRGWELSVLPVSSSGFVEVEAVARALKPTTALVSVMFANNEIGTLQPIQAIGQLLADHPAVFHTDATQAAGQVPIDVTRDRIDLLSLSSHKLYGPKGVGCLYRRRGRPRVALSAQIFGGGQEGKLRSGTVAVPLIVGFGQAAQLITQADTPSETVRIERLRDQLWSLIHDALPETQRNGAQPLLPNTLNLSLAGVDTEALLIGLRHQVACSSGSACSSETLRPSHVLDAMGFPKERKRSALRFGLGRWTTEEQVAKAATCLIEKARALKKL